MHHFFFNLLWVYEVFESFSKYLLINKPYKRCKWDRVTVLMFVWLGYMRIGHLCVLFIFQEFDDLTSSEKMIHPINRAPRSKRSFIPSKSEAKKVSIGHWLKWRYRDILCLSDPLYKGARDVNTPALLPRCLHIRGFTVTDSIINRVLMWETFLHWLISNFFAQLIDSGRFPGHIDAKTW